MDVNRRVRVGGYFVKQTDIQIDVVRQTGIKVDAWNTSGIDGRKRQTAIQVSLDVNVRQRDCPRGSHQELRS